MSNAYKTHMRIEFHKSYFNYSYLLTYYTN
nr:MAG TPA: hypothetical protein [Siphoviridae sp. ctBWu8]DAK97047.1 MAG TPA: hypothetical protein [Caudoviricetes sp.]